MSKYHTQTTAKRHQYPAPWDDSADITVESRIVLVEKRYAREFVYDMGSLHDWAGPVQNAIDVLSEMVASCPDLRLEVEEGFYQHQRLVAVWVEPLDDADLKVIRTRAASGGVANAN